MSVIAGARMSACVGDLLGAQSPAVKALRELVVANPPTPSSVEVTARGPRVVESSCILLIRRNEATDKPQIYLQERTGSWRSGFWATPAGHLEPGEAPVDAAARELQEETGLSVAPQCFRPVLKCWTEPDVDDMDPRVRRLDHWFVVRDFSGDPVALETHRASRSAFFDLDEIRSLAMVAKYRASLTAILNGVKEIELTSSELALLHSLETRRPRIPDGDRFALREVEPSALSLGIELPPKALEPLF